MNHATTVYECHRSLAQSFEAAWRTDVTQSIPTPGFSDPQTPLTEVLNDSLASPGNEAALGELMDICRQVAAGRFSHQLHEQAEKLIKAQAERFASYHAEDMAAELIDHAANRADALA